MRYLLPLVLLIAAGAASAAAIDPNVTAYIPRVKPGECPASGDVHYKLNLEKGKLYRFDVEGGPATVRFSRLAGDSLFITDDFMIGMVDRSYDAYRTADMPYLAVNCVSTPVAFRATLSKDNVAFQVKTAPGALVTAFGPLTSNAFADANGYANLVVQKGQYKLRVLTGEGSVWYGGPGPYAKTLNIPAAGKKAFPISGRPVITGLTRSGDTVTITGSGFGKSKGWVDFGGSIDRPKGTWAKTGDSITAKVPAGASGCVRVYAATGGWSSECAAF